MPDDYDIESARAALRSATHDVTLSALLAALVRLQRLEKKVDEFLKAGKQKEGT